MEYVTKPEGRLHEPAKVLVVYGSDYSKISPGGITNYVQMMDERAPEHLDIRYLGIRGEYGGFPIPKDRFIGLDVKPILKTWNLGFLNGLRKSTFRNYDIILCHRAETALFIRLLSRIPVFLVLHGGTLNAIRSGKFFFGSTYPFIELIATLSATKTMSVNPEATFLLTRKLKNVSQAPLVVDQKYFFKVSNNMKDEIFLIGRLEKEKRFKIAFDILSDCEATIKKIPRINVIGDGSNRKDLEKHAAKLNLDVKFHGMTNKEKVANLLQCHGKYLIITSKFEGFPIVALEAISCGVTVLALKAPGVGRNLSGIGVKIFNDPQSMSAYISSNIGKNSLEDSNQNEIGELLTESSDDYWEIVEKIISSRRNKQA